MQSPEHAEAQEPAPGEAETTSTATSSRCAASSSPATAAPAAPRASATSPAAVTSAAATCAAPRSSAPPTSPSTRPCAPPPPTSAPGASRRRWPPTTPALLLERHDLRQKVRQRKTGTLIVFVVDASASMDAEQRMQATKGAVLSLLRDAYVRRDKVAVVVFSGRTARVVLRPTNSVDLAQDRLERLTVGGTTPLTHGLVAGSSSSAPSGCATPPSYPLMVLISDGRGNISLFGEEPIVEAQRVAAQIKTEQVRSLVIDSARDYTQHAQLPPDRRPRGPADLRRLRLQRLPRPRRAAGGQVLRALRPLPGGDPAVGPAGAARRMSGPPLRESRP